MSKYKETMRDALVSMTEGFSKKEIKMAIGIASDPRYKGGNYTGAFNAIEKIKKGLAKHPQVAAVLKRQNTSFDPEIAEAGHDDVKSAKNQVQIAMSALEKMNTELGKLKDEDSLPTWWTNKVAVSVDKLDGMADYLDTQVEEVELDEAMKYTHAVVDPDGKVAGMTTDEKDAKDIASRHKGKVVKLKKPIAQKVGDMMINRPLKEKVEYVEYKFKNKNDAMAVKKMLDGIQLMSFDINDDNISGGELAVDAGKKDMTKYHKEIMKKYRPKVITQEHFVESWELDEMKMDDPKLLKIFDKLKKGSTVKIKIDSSISKGKDYREFTVTAKNIVGKGKKFEQEKITLKAKDNPTGVKHFLYNRDGKVTLAIGDMGASIADIKENNMSAYTAAITKGVK